MRERDLIPDRIPIDFVNQSASRSPGHIISDPGYVGSRSLTVTALSGLLARIIGKGTHILYDPAQPARGAGHFSELHRQASELRRSYCSVCGGGQGGLATQKALGPSWRAGAFWGAWPCTAPAPAMDNNAAERALRGFKSARLAAVVKAHLTAGGDFQKILNRKISNRRISKAGSGDAGLCW